MLVTFAPSPIIFLNGFFGFSHFQIRSAPMIRTILTTAATLALCIVFTGCDSSTAKSDAAQHDKGPRPTAAPQKAPGAGIGDTSRSGDSGVGRRPGTASPGTATPSTGG